MNHVASGSNNAGAIRYAHRDVTAEVRPSLCDIQTTFSQTLLSFYCVMLLSICCPSTWTLGQRTQISSTRYRLRLRWYYSNKHYVLV